MPRRLIGQTDSTGRLRRKRKGAFGSALFGNTNPDAITPERQELIKLWSSDPWEFMQARDTDGTPIILTQDESDEGSPYKPIPAEYTFVRILLRELFGPIQPVIIDKPRQTMASITCCFGMYWLCLFRDARRCYLSKHKEDEAAEMLQDKVRSIHTRTPKWFQKAYPITTEPANKVYFPASNSVITAVSQTAAEGALRGPTPSVAVIDEAAFQDNFKDLFQAAAASALTNGCRIWIPTTPHLGPGGRFVRSLIEGRELAEIVREDMLQDDIEEINPANGPGWDQR